MPSVPRVPRVARIAGIARIAGVATIRRINERVKATIRKNRSQILTGCTDNRVVAPRQPADPFARRRKDILVRCSTAECDPNPTGIKQVLGHRVLNRYDSCFGFVGCLLDMSRPNALPLRVRPEMTNKEVPSLDLGCRNDGVS